MYILKNSLKNLIRNKGRNVLLLVIMIAILSSTAVAIIINTTSNGIIQDYKNRFGSEVFIQPNQKKSDELIKEGKMEELYKGTPNDIKEKIAESKYLKETIFTAGYPGYSDKLKSLDQQDKKSNGFGSMGFAVGGGERSKDAKDPNLNILGGLSKSGAEEFKDGTRKIKEGKMPEKSGETVISEDFAKLNKLKVGDKLKIKNPENPNKVEPLELTVSGIYEDKTKANDMGIKHLMLNRKNEVITTYNTLKEYNEKVKKDKDIIEIDAKYFLNNPDDVEAFNKEAHEKGLSEVNDVSIDTIAYEKIVKPIEGLKKVSNMFLILVLGFGGSVLVLISILSIRERKYEIGVLRAMGMKKGKVGLGLIFENIALILVSLGIGLGIASLVSGPVSNMLLQGQLEAKNNDMSTVMVSLGPQSAPDPIDSINAALSADAILLIALVALLLGLVSVIIGILYINRYEPRKILTERN